MREATPHRESGQCLFMITSAPPGTSIAWIPRISIENLCEVSDDVFSRIEVGDSNVGEVARVGKGPLTRESRLAEA